MQGRCVASGLEHLHRQSRQVVLLGPPGAGNTHLVIALGQRASYMPFDSDATNPFFQLVAHRYERAQSW